MALQRTPKLSVSLLVTFIMVTGFTSVSLGMSVFGGRNTTPTDPFAAYSDIFPGQPSDAVLARGFSRPTSFFFASDPPIADETCILYPVTGIFRQVQVVVDNDSVQSITFIMRENSLRLGDIMALWGTPEVRGYFTWPDRGIMAWPADLRGEFSPFVPLLKVTFIETR